MKLLKLSAALLALTAISGIDTNAQGTASFSYRDPNEQLVGYGTNKNETYNVAIRVKDPMMVGKKIVGLSVPAPYSENITDIKAFITENLAAGKPEGSTVRQNLPDVCEVQAQDNHGSYTATFTEPYTLKEEGVYVGYTFTVTAQDAVTRQPVACVHGNNSDAFLLMTSKTFYQWTSKSSAFNLISAIEVIFEGDFESNSLGVDIDNSNVLMAGQSLQLPISIINHGTEAIKNFEYTVTIDDDQYSGTYTFETPAQMTYGAVQEVAINVDLATTPGQKDITVTIDKVNGEVNNDGQKSKTVSMGLLKRVPVKRPVMEEFTGTSCGYCPRGFAAMEYMNKKYGTHLLKEGKQRFIALAYHNYSQADPMYTVPNLSMPISFTGAPGCMLDRNGKTLDPYYGTSGSSFGIESDWLELSKEFTPIDLEVNANWESTTSNRIEVHADVVFARKYEGTVRLAYVLVGDGLSGPLWNQSNYFSGQNKSNFEIEEMAKFCEGPKNVYGLTFDDCILMFSNLTGEYNTLQGELPINEKIRESYVFNANNCQTLSSTENKNWALELRNETSDKLRVVVLAVDANTRKIINANTCFVAPDGTNVDAIRTESEVVAEEYYDMSGVRVMNPKAGLYVRVVKYVDGNSSSSKVVVK